MSVFVRCDGCPREERLNIYENDGGPRFLLYSTLHQVWWRAVPSSKEGAPPKIFCPRCAKLRALRKAFVSKAPN